LDYALNDEREDVCFNVLYDLVLLGKHDIMFDETHIVRLLKVVVSMKQSNRTKQRAFKCAQSLFESHQKLIGHLILNDTPELQEFTRYVFQCEQILLDAILNKQYTFIVACGRLLFTIIRIIVSQKVDKDQMDVDIPIRIQIQDLALNISNHISKVYITVIEDQNISRSLKKIYVNRTTCWLENEFTECICIFQFI
jgi:hypothetical protein